MELTPLEIVRELDKYIIGQEEAKKAVAVALRNRYRRNKLPEEIRDEITPKNIIMQGPTGVGKTEIARRLSRLVSAPFVKVEATKYTEVGYVGRDVESMVRDLVEASIHIVKEERMEAVKPQAEAAAERRIIDILAGEKKHDQPMSNPFAALFGQPKLPEAPAETEEERTEKLTKREKIEKALRAGTLDRNTIQIEVEDSGGIGIEIAGIGADLNIGEIVSGMMPKKTKTRNVTVAEARKILEQEEASKLLDMDDINTEAVRRAEQEGIIFIDEIDKVIARGSGHGPDVSREGVQRDILPIVEGSTVNTKYGPVKTDYMLFIAAGAFHNAKVSDLMPELQGRFPIVVELKSLHKDDFVKILSQPENAITKQYQSLLSADGINLTFTDQALETVADFAEKANSTMENIGARRLHTIIEAVLDDISFNAGDIDPPVDLVIDADYVKEHLKGYLKEKDLKRFII